LWGVFKNGGSDMVPVRLYTLPHVDMEERVYFLFVFKF